MSLPIVPPLHEPQLGPSHARRQSLSESIEASLRPKGPCRLKPSFLLLDAPFSLDGPTGLLLLRLF